MECSEQIGTIINSNIDIFNDIRPESFLRKQAYDIDNYKLLFKSCPSYICVYEGMGCYSIIRRLNPNSKFEGLFVHSDDHYSQDKVQKNEQFINGYLQIELENMHTHEWRNI
jgi:hypothetical protein